MRCVIPGGNVKVLAKAIHTLAKIGDEMYVYPQQECISFRTANMSKSAYSDFTFQKNFFSYYSLGNTEEEEAQRCKISMRSAMTVFKSAHLLDKQVETCHIHLELDACDLIFILKYKNGINKSHLSPILDSEKLQASYTKIGMTNELTSRARMLVDALQNFQQNLFEITLEITPQKLLLRNYVDDASATANITRTQLVLGIGEFDRYMVGNETVISFCLKEFKALLTFSESVGVPINAHFETAGRPVLFTLKNQSFEVNLLLSTLNPDTDSQSDVSVISRRQVQSARRKKSSRSTSRRDNKSSTRTREKTTSPVDPTVNSTFGKRQAEEMNQRDKTDPTRGASTSAEAGASNVNIVRKKNQSGSKEQNRPFAISPASTRSSTSSTVRKRITENQKKLVSSVFSNIAKRKSSTSDEEGGAKDIDESVPCSPPRRVTKKAKVVFQKCFQDTFDPRMLPGHDIILVEDSDDNNSD